MSSRKLILSFIAVFLLLSLSFVGVGEADSLVWSQTYGGIEEEGAHSVIETSDGGYAMVGGARLFKTDEFGNLEWNQTYSSGGSSAVHSGGSSFVQTSDGGYAIAKDNRLFKTNSTGHMEWNQTYGDGRAASLVATSDGGYAISGSAPDGTGWGDFWLVKTDALGNMEWSNKYGGEFGEGGSSVLETTDGGYILFGISCPQPSLEMMPSELLIVKTDAYGNMTWNNTLSINALMYYYSAVEASDGGYVIAGTTHSKIGRSYDAWLAKVNDAGNLEWHQEYGGTSEDSAKSLVATLDGGYAICGTTKSFPTQGGYDFWLLKTDATGNMEWNKTYGGISEDVARSLVATSDGGYALAGYTKSFGAGSYDVWLVKTDEVGFVPEYSSLLIPSLLLTATLVIVIYKKFFDGHPIES